MYHLIASILQLKFWGGGCELVDELVDSIAQSSIFVSLKVGIEIIFGETLVNLGTIC